MKIKLHNQLHLETVSDSNLEQLRVLRNHSSIQRVLVESGIITKSEQKSWFSKVDRKKNIYFLIYISEELKGYALLKNINSQKHTGEPGIFLIDGQYYDSSLGGLLTISFLDFCHDFFGIAYFHGNVLKTNNRALLNYQFFDTSIELHTDEFQLTAKKTYSEMNYINKLRRFISKTELYSRTFTINYSPDNHEGTPITYNKDNIFINNHKF